jgi:hypothetical protein
VTADARAELALGGAVKLRAALGAEVVDIVDVFAGARLVNELIEREAGQDQRDLLQPVFPLDGLTDGTAGAHA